VPDNAGWFLNPTAIQASQYGWPGNVEQPISVGARSSTLLLDDVLGDQFMYGPARSAFQFPAQTFAPSPIGMAASSGRITVTPDTRGLVPRPDPRNGIPIIAFVGVGQTSNPGTTISVPSPIAVAVPVGSWVNPQNLRTMAQVNVLERSTYVLP
jgi:hypothetical protein